MSSGDDSSSSSSKVESVDPPLTCVLIIGQSFSGKSNLCRQLVKEFKKYRRPVYCLNDETRNCPYKRVEWTNVDQLERCGIVVEDVVGLNQRKFEILSHLLSWSCHHKSISPCYVIAHAIQKTNVFGLLPYFGIIYLSCCPSNVASFKRLLSYFSFTTDEKEAYIKKLNNCKRRFAHFRITVKTRKIELVRYPYQSPMEAAANSDSDSDNHNSNGGNIDRLGKTMDRIKKKRAAKRRDAIAAASAKRFLSVGTVLKDKDKADVAGAIWDLIFDSLPKDKINPHNLTITLKKNNVGRSNTVVVISIIDYICSLLREDHEPSKIIVQFHRFVSETKQIKIPQVFILNKYFHD